MEDRWLVYLAAFGGALLLSLALTPLARRVAVRWDVLDHPGGHKSHDEAVPYLGGVAIAVAFSSAVFAAALIESPPGGLGELAVILGLGIVLSLMGLVDDLRSVPVLPRLAVQILAALALWAVGVGVDLLPWSAADLVLTVAWVVGITNAFNLLDNMDGLSAGLAAIAAGWFALIAGLNGQFLVATLAAAVAGCSLGFLRENAHPARIYMGDAGSLFLGFLLAVIGIKLRFDGPVEVTFFVPILVLGIAVLDTVVVVVSRLRLGRSVFAPGRDHVSHRLVTIGLPVPVAVWSIYGVAFGLGWLAAVMSRLDVMTAFALMGLVVTAGTVMLVALLEVDPTDHTGSR